MINPKERYAELDLFRFFAAFSVLVFHYQAKYIESYNGYSIQAAYLYEFTKFGYLGIDLFFIISGFVIFASTFERTGFQFAVSRITRLYPTFWVCCSITVLIVLLLESKENHSTLTQWLANLTLFNTHLGVENIDGIYWTLGIEIKFYFCIFLLLIFNLLQYYRIWISIWLAMTVSYLLTKQPFFFHRIISPEYSSYFIAGVVFFLARQNGYRPFYIITLIISFLVSLSYANKTISGFILHYGISIYDRIIMSAILFCMYWIFYLVSVRRISLQSSTILLAIGGMTYPLYLLHNRAGKAIYDYFKGPIPSPILLILIAILMLFMSLIIHIFLEKRISDRLKSALMHINRNWKMGKKRQPPKHD